MPSSTVSFTLPQNCILRVSSIAVHARIATTGTATRIPDAMSLLERVEVSMGGAVISGASSYHGKAVAIKRALTGLRGDVETQHGIVAPKLPYQADHTFEGQTDANTLDGNEECQLTFSGWEYGWLASKPEYQDMSKLPPTVVRLTFATPSVICGSGSVSYTVSNLSATMEVATISNPSYDSMLSSIMSQKSYLPVCFREAYVIRASHGGITRASVSSRSLDRVMVAFQNRDYDSNQPPLEISTNYPLPYQHETHLAACEIFGPAKYPPGGLLYPLSTEFWLSLGGTRFPQHRATFDREWPNISRNARYIEEFNNLPAPLCGSLQATAKAVQCAKLNLAGSASPCIATGINSRQQSLVIEAHTGSGFAGVNEVICYILAETSSLLMIGSNREVSLSR